MSVNILGKTLVFVHLVVSVLAASFAAGIFFQQIDWGWKEPRKDLYLRVPSEIDKRTAAVLEALRAREMAIGTATQPGTLTFAETRWQEVEPCYWENHLWYRQQLARLRSDPGPIDVKEVKFVNGVVQLDTPIDKPRTGKPILEAPVPVIEKSFDTYARELKKLQADIVKVEADLKKLLAQENDITFKLTGKDETGTIVNIGLYTLLDDEKQQQDQLKKENDYLQPLWVEALDRAELFYERRARLEQTLGNLKNAGRR